MSVTEFLESLTEDQLFALMNILQTIEISTADDLLEFVYEELNVRGL